jgi:dihydroorotate dehydrogenase (NAD+) catalytic subunit
MAILITRPGKNALYLDSPVMPAAGTFGYGNTYRGLIDHSQLGAIVTNPVTYQPWSPAAGTRVVPLDAGVLMHTGLPNVGLKKVIREFSQVWASLPCPLILHLVATDKAEVRKAAEILDHAESVAAIELGLPDDISAEEAHRFTMAAVRGALEKPVLVRLPLGDAFEIAEPIAEAGAAGLVIAAPPRGTARDPRSGQLIQGRIYGPLIKPIALHMVQVLHERLTDVPIIGAGGIHSLDDARDYLEAGAVAVQVDSVTWVQPNLLERIARDLSGGLVTRMSDAFPDEWHADMGDTEFRDRFSD